MLAFLFSLEAVKFGLLFFFKTLLNLLAQIFWELSVALLANRLAIPGSELAILERSVAGGTEEVICMVSFLKELLATRRDRLLAIRTIITKKLHIMRLAVGEAVVFEEM